MTQTQAIHRHLKERGSITPIEALHEYGCFRLAARIHELRVKGVPIETSTVNRRNVKHAKYHLATESEAES